MSSSLKRVIKKIASLRSFWVAEQTMAHLESIRTYEIGLVIHMLPAKGNLLEIGAGTGWQAKALAQCGYEVHAIDLPASTYSDNRVWQITEYDGKHIPYDDGSFDVIVSSNVLEHVPHLVEFQQEMLRLLKPGGCVVHVLPSGSWRFWTNITHLLKCWTLPEVHGEHAANAWSEINCFSRRSWLRQFNATGWTVVTQRGNRLFYTGHSVMDSRLSIRLRIAMSQVLGSSCNLFLLRKSNSIRS